MISPYTLNVVHNEDCLKVLNKMPDNSVHSIVTDPPYEIGFMGRAWDNTGIAFKVELWKQCLRVLKPGGYLLAFSSTRTYHRMACAIEDAGFEIRDKIDNFSSMTNDIVSFYESLDDQQQRAFERLLESQSDTGILSWIYSSGMPKSINVQKAIENKFKNQPEMQNKASVWEGWYGGLKPSNEPICVARKPISEKTIAENVLKWGTGAFNIDACRISHNEKVKTTNRKSRSDSATWNKDTCGLDSSKNTLASANPKGRFTPNAVFDEDTAKLLDNQSGLLKSGSNCIRKKEATFLEHKLSGKSGDIQITYGDEGGASRFFYCAKASKSEKGEYNNHPTVKPKKLIKFLLQLVTPKGGISLDPFAGSGTHLVSCIELGIYYVACEKEEKSFEICQRRIEDTKRKLNLNKY